ncbi:leucine-rich repeat-containing protein 24-like [Diorhabda sublineata]|uniref:leucine-rich repeat-containing protein 24-like n=1 Tax=Diorhabda sublineata TaxID=1163346 RepID=UPI0024E0A4E0|nr:leucine-rich repeat-containing protein 24-like [Diorhabda sublineata]
MATLCLLVFFVALALAAPDWTDCPTPCRCTWSSGKKTALCQKAGFTDIPGSLDEGIQVIDLSGNFLSKLPRAVFQSVGLINLQRIYLSRAGLTEIHQDAFNSLTILVEIDLSNNEITFLHPNTFHGTERLRMLSLNGNPLKQLVRAQFPPLPHLRSLELEGCSLEIINKEAFIHLTALETINLKYNLLRNISEATFMNFAHLKTLALEENPWRCDCNLRGFRDWFLASKLQSVSLSCSEPRSLSERLWENVSSEEFACIPQVFAYPQQQVQAEAGGNVSFGCHILGDPEPQVLWLYEGHPINHTWLVVEAEEGLLDKWANISIYNVSDADVGRYTCVAKNILDTTSVNVSLVLPEVVTATTLIKADKRMVWWGMVIVGVGVAFSAVITVIAVYCVKNKSQRRNIKASVSFTDQEKKLLDVSIATTTDRGTGSCEALGPEQLDMMDPPVHITIEREPPLPPLAVYPPPPEFSSSTLPAGAYGNIFISVSVSRDPSIDVSRCPDLLDLPHRPKPVYHGMATLPRRPYAFPQYDNMGPRVTAGGSSTLSLPDASAGAPIAAVATQLPPPPPPPCVPLTPEFVSL